MQLLSALRGAVLGGLCGFGLYYATAQELHGAATQAGQGLTNAAAVLRGEAQAAWHNLTQQNVGQVGPWNTAELQRSWNHSVTRLLQGSLVEGHGPQESFKPVAQLREGAISAVVGAAQVAQQGLKVTPLTDEDAQRLAAMHDEGRKVLQPSAGQTDANE